MINKNDKKAFPEEQPNTPSNHDFPDNIMGTIPASEEDFIQVDNSKHIKKVEISTEKSILAIHLNCCNIDVSIGNRYCPNCGKIIDKSTAPMTGLMPDNCKPPFAICTCGFVNSHSNYFCVSCGSRLRAKKF